MSENSVVITNGNKTYAIPEKDFDKYIMSESEAKKILIELEEASGDVEGQVCEEWRIRSGGCAVSNG